MGKLTKAQARAWVREHWQSFMWGADCPDLPNTEDGELIAEVFCDESKRLAWRLRPRGRAALAPPQDKERDA